MNGITGNSPAARARRRMLILALIFVLPILIAYALYYSGWRPASSGNYGELVRPPRPLPALTLETLEGKTLALESLRGKWSLVVFAPDECRDPCTANLDKMQRVILAQGKEAERVRAVLAVTDARTRDGLRDAIKAYPGMLVVAGPAAPVRAFAARFELTPGVPPDNLNRVYLVDPIGNFMMSWPADADANRMRKDLARLLRVSQVG